MRTSFWATAELEKSRERHNHKEMLLAVARRSYLIFMYLHKRTVSEFVRLTLTNPARASGTRNESAGKKRVQNIVFHNRWGCDGAGNLRLRNFVQRTSI